jgi:predicted DNA-binding protein (MmcQ/YjbR family)
MALDHAQILAILQAKAGAEAGYPFDETARVYKVGGKMFALVAEEADPLRLNLKCDPQDALALRRQHAAILPGYHMNKRHWNTLVLDGSLSDSLVRELIDHSYELVVAGLPKRVRGEVIRMRDGG